MGDEDELNIPPLEHLHQIVEIVDASVRLQVNIRGVGEVHSATTGLEEEVVGDEAREVLSADLSRLASLSSSGHAVRSPRLALHREQELVCGHPGAAASNVDCRTLVLDGGRSEETGILNTSLSDSIGLLPGKALTTWRQAGKKSIWAALR